MTTLFLCGPDEITGFGCLCCGGSIHAVAEGGFRTTRGTFCSEDCIFDDEEFNVETHLRLRDMLCDCEEICAPRGLPTAEDLQEYETYLREIS